MNSEDENLFNLLKKSVDKCYKNDLELINRSMEQACVARIFFYMQEMIYNDPKYKEYRDYNLDCEYNKNGEQIKATPRRQNGTKPDMILHKRRTNNKNLIVVEFKAAQGRTVYYEDTKTAMDYVKLEDFTNSAIYNYKLGVYVKLNKRKPKYILFKNGKIYKGEYNV
mgnify:CR=1 FL=1